MGLIALAQIEPALVCPRCRTGLAGADGSYRCSASDCGLAEPGSFPLAGGTPVVVDFEESILQRGDFTGSGGADPLQAPGRWSIEHAPRRLRSWWKPTNRVAEHNIDALLTRLEPEATVLVVGGGTVGNGTGRLYADSTIKTIAFDVYASPWVQLVADAHSIPFADASVDAVVVQAVLEHVVDPRRAVEEIRRVLRPAGFVYAETPFLQQVHAGPYDFERFTSSGHRYLFRGFEELAAGPVAGPGTQLLWSLDHLVRGLTRSELAGKLVRAMFFGLRYLDRLVPERYAMDNASAYYFLGRRAEHELTPQELVAYYRGAQRH